MMGGRFEWDQSLKHNVQNSPTKKFCGQITTCVNFWTLRKEKGTWEYNSESVPMPNSHIGIFQYK